MTILAKDKKIIRVEEMQDSMHLTWIVNSICQNSCSYCPPSIHNGSNHNYEWKNAERFILELFKRYDKIWVSIAGGEPTLSPFLPKLIDMFYQKNHKVTLTTNGGRTARYWKEIAPKINGISFSYHPEFPNSNFLENVIISSENTCVHVKVMMYNKFWDHCVEKAEELFLDKRFVTLPTRIVNWLGDRMPLNQDYYNEEQILWFNEWSRRPVPRDARWRPVSDNFGSIHHFSDGTIEKRPSSTHLINRGLTNFKGYTCNIGLSSLYVNDNGFVKRGNCMEGGIIGSINSPENIQWPDKPIICTQSLCTCSSDVDIAKEIIQ